MSEHCKDEKGCHQVERNELIKKIGDWKGVEVDPKSDLLVLKAWNGALEKVSTYLREGEEQEECGIACDSKRGKPCQLGSPRPESPKEELIVSTTIGQRLLLKCPDCEKEYSFPKETECCEKCSGWFKCDFVDCPCHKGKEEVYIGQLPRPL